MYQSSTVPVIHCTICTSHTTATETVKQVKISKAYTLIYERIKMKEVINIITQGAK